MSTYSINMRNQICNAVVPRCKCRLTAGHERQIHCIYNPSERLRFGTGSLDGPPPPAAGPGCWAPSLAFATAVAAARSMSSSCPCMRRFRLRFGMSTFGLSRSRVSGLKALRLRSTSRMADRSYEWPSDATTGSAAQAGHACGGGARALRAARAVAAHLASWPT